MDLNLSLSVSAPEPTRVPNELPTVFAPYKILFLGEAPGESEVAELQPFAGFSGQLLTQVMSANGIIRSACMMGNACQYRPDKNNIKLFSPHGQEFRKSREYLSQDLSGAFRPNLVVLLGDTALGFAGHGDKKVSTWRGSILQCTEIGNPLYGLKLLPTYHPSQILRCHDDLPLFNFDIARAAREGLSPLINRPNRHLVTIKSVGEIVLRFQQLRETRAFTTLDIEGWVYNVSCISFATSPTEAFCVPLISLSRSDLRTVLRAMSDYLMDPHCPKGLQNGLYDATVLALTYGILIRNFCHDTMLGMWEMYPELPKSLAVQTSILTDEPYYKFERKTDSLDVHFNYCSKDSAVTYEIVDKQQRMMNETEKSHYRFNVNMLKPILYTQIRGIRWDVERAQELSRQNKIKIAEVTDRLRERTKNPKFNPRSHTQVKNLLYKQLRLPEQKKKEAGRKTEKTTSDVKALLELLKTYQIPHLVDLLLFSKLAKRQQYIDMKFDRDGRMRCSYNVVGSETGRLSCSKAAHGVGDNLQTVPKDLRHLLLADEGYEFFQCDLEGADGWTVAAECKLRGDSRMFDDYLFGLKPAKIIALMFLAFNYYANPTTALANFPVISDLLPFFTPDARDVNSWTRDKLKLAAKFITEEGPMGWLYFTCKRCQHATNYGTGVDTMMDQVLSDSYKILGTPMVVERKTCTVLQDLYRMRYPGVGFWQGDCKSYLHNVRGFPTLSDASGHERKFFARPKDHATLRTFLSHQPQANTTYATNMAILNLWNDPENRRGNSLIIQPLHQVHDALCGQWPIEHRDFGQRKVKQYFNNPMTIANTELVIPYDGGYGSSWGDCKNKFD